MKSVAIVGGGITGLVAAFYLKRRGLDVHLYESAPRVGGVIRTIRKDGFLAESGPNTIMETAPEITQLIRDLNLADSRIYSSPNAEKRFIVRGGRAMEMPASPAGFFTSKFFSWRAKLGLLREPFVFRGPAHREETLAEFVKRRLGQEFLDYAINPFVAGVYAGDPARLSVKEAFPKLHAIEQRYGSLILGQILGARERKKRGAVSKQNAPKFSFPLGLEQLIETLARELDGSIHLRHSLKVVERTSQGWNLTLCTPSGVREEEHDAVLLCAPAFKLSEVLLIAPKAPSLDFLSQVHYAPVSTLALGFHRDQLRHPLDGFGFLVPEVEHLHTLGAIFSSSLFPDRAPKDHVLLTCYLGGLRAPKLPSSNQAVQVGFALHDLAKILGVSGHPVFTNLAVHQKAIPQYELGFGRIRDKISRLEAQCPGLHFAGNWRNGISLSDSISAGVAAAQTIAEDKNANPKHEFAEAA